MQQKGLRPSTAIPAAKVTACCSAIPTSYVRFGNLLPNMSIPVPPVKTQAVVVVVVVVVLLLLVVARALKMPLIAVLIKKRFDKVPYDNTHSYGSGVLDTWAHSDRRLEGGG